LILQEGLKVFLVHRKVYNELLEFLLESLFSLIKGLISPLLAQVSPSRLDAGNSTSIYGINIELDEGEPLAAVHFMTLDSLYSHILEDTLSKGVYLFHKFGAQLPQVPALKVLELVLVGKRADHGLALSLLEVALESTPYLVLRVIELPLLS
jgi:hypothetical protein